MAIDYTVDLSCIPKAGLTTEGIIGRLKARAQASEIIRLFREAGDPRPPSEMGFELTRATPDGDETRLLVVQDLMDDAGMLDPYVNHCKLCTANVSGTPFGCVGKIGYPITGEAERWLLDQLPSIDEPLVWLLLRQGVQELGYDGERVRGLRANSSLFEEPRLAGRDLVEFVFNADQVFEMLFMTGHIQPAHAGVLLLLFKAVPRAVEADKIMAILRGEPGASLAQEFPLVLTIDDDDDDVGVRDFKQFFIALHRAWTLGVQMLLDV